MENDVRDASEYVYIMAYMLLLFEIHFLLLCYFKHSRSLLQLFLLKMLSVDFEVLLEAHSKEFGYITVCGK